MFVVTTGSVTVLTDWNANIFFFYFEHFFPRGSKRSIVVSVLSRGGKKHKHTFTADRLVVINWTADFEPRAKSRAISITTRSWTDKHEANLAHDPAVRLRLTKWLKNQNKTSLAGRATTCFGLSLSCLALNSAQLSEDIFL